MSRRSVIETSRLRLSELSEDDAVFIFDLVNQPSWLRNIGDKGVHSLDDARRYISDGPCTMYGRHGFGLWRVERKDSGEVIGLCGLIKRDALTDVDIGFAFLPRFWGQGYAFEAAQASMSHGLTRLALPRIVAIVSPNNQPSIRLLEKLGLRCQRTIQLTPGDDVLFFS